MVLRAQSIILAIASTIAVLTCAGANVVSQQSAPFDPYMLNETAVQWIGYFINKDTTAKTLSSQTVNTSVANLILIVAGQSNIDNMNYATAYTVSNPSALDNLNIYDGAIYKAVTPLVGTSATGSGQANYAHAGLIVADALVTAGKFARVILVPVAIGSSSVADWGGGTANAGDFAAGTFVSRIPVALARMTQRGITCGSTNVTCAVIWGQGEGDTFYSTSQANYVASFNNMVTNAANAGFVGRWFVAKQTYYNSATDATIQAAQTANATSGVINNSAGIYLGANSDALVGNVCNGSNACREDVTHFSYNGTVAYATDATNGWQAAMHASGSPY
jgi:hypothetical protein